MNKFYINLLALILVSLLAVNTVKAQNYQWTKTFGVSSGITLSKAIALDQNGNVLTVGTFTGTVDFNPGAGVSNLTATSTKDVYISKLDAAGNFLWAKRLGGPSNINFPNTANGFTIATDLSGNVIIGGSFIYEIDVNPDPVAVVTYNNAGFDLGGTDAFILKLTPNGDYLWSQQIGNTGGDVVSGITTDATGNIFAVGSFNGNVDFDGSAATFNITSAGLDIFVLKLASTGTFGFVKTFGGTATDIGNAITVDGAGNIYTTGYFSGTADFDPGATTANLVSNGGGDVFISKLSSTGNYTWAKSFGGIYGPTPDQGNALTIDEQGNVFVAGTFRSTTTNVAVDFDPSAGVDNKFFVGGIDFFVSKFTAAGNYVFSVTAGSFTSDFVYAVSIDAEDNISLLGSFSGEIDFDPDLALDYILIPEQTTSATNSTDLFFAKYSPTGTLQLVSTIGSNSTDIGYGMVIDGASNIFITGIFSGAADFDPSATNTTITPLGSQDGFVTKWNICNNIGALPATAISKVKTMGLTNLPTIFANANCEIIAKVSANGANPIIGNATAKVWVETTQPNTSNSIFVKRHYEITPTANATTATGKVTLYFTQQEFNDFNAVSTIDLPTNPLDNLGIANLLVEKKAGVSNNGTGLPASYTNGAVNINPLDGDVMWNEGTKRWEVSFAVTGFSGFFIKTQTALLPLRWQVISGDINKLNQATINWTVQENNVLKYEVEKSNEGNIFENIKTVSSIGDGENKYSIIDIVKDLNPIYYRVKQIDITGNFTYSSVVKLQPFNTKQVSVYPNPVKELAIITVNNTYLNTAAQITDLNGKVIKSFNISNSTFSVDIAALPAGIYFLKMKEGRTEKIIKQ